MLLITQVYGISHKHTDRKHQFHNHEQASSYQESRRTCFMPTCFCSNHATPWQSAKSLAHEATLKNRWPKSPRSVVKIWTPQYMKTLLGCQCHRSSTGNARDPIPVPGTAHRAGASARMTTSRRHVRCEEKRTITHFIHPIAPK